MSVISHTTTSNTTNETPREARTYTVAFQGVLGAYSEEAIVTIWDEQTTALSRRTFEEVIEAVHTGQAEYGVLPIENTVVGPIVAVHLALERAKSLYPNITTIDETRIDIHHALLAPRGATIERLTQVSSHPAALAQCQRFLSQHPQITIMESYDTAGAAQDVAHNGIVSAAAIAGTRSAQLYHLDILAENIQDVPNNQTRFIVIANTRGDRW